MSFFVHKIADNVIVIASGLPMNRQRRLGKRVSRFMKRSPFRPGMGTHFIARRSLSECCATTGRLEAKGARKGNAWKHASKSNTTISSRPQRQLVALQELADVSDIGLREALADDPAPRVPG